MGSNMLVLNRSASSDCDVWSRSGYGRWNREGKSSTTAHAHVLRNDDREAAEQAAAFLIGNGWDPADEGDS
jgi:hypothetical protein